jgi:hypothetical protein
MLSFVVSWGSLPCSPNPFGEESCCQLSWLYWDTSLLRLVKLKCHPTRTDRTVEWMRILLAEDNRVNQAVASRLSAKLGHTLVIANNGKEAIDLLKQQTFDLVLMDVQMSEMDGIVATREFANARDQPMATYRSLL